ncbi:MAG TPA: AsmA family protein, partial [Burkholderiaceae bacterium]|nr:AsmA family protein [Burkholderiaceae bacterium]
DELDLGSAAIAPLKSLRAHVLLEQAVLQLQNVDATVAGGRITGSTRLDARGQPARWAADLRFAKVDVAAWIRALQGANSGGRQSADPRTLRQQRQAARQGGDQPVRAYLTGELSGAIDMTGSGRSTAEILGSLDGQARFALGEGTMSHLVTEVAGLDVAQALGVFVRGDKSLPLRCARVQLVSQHGLVRLRQAVMDSRDSTFFATGQINLKDESLALRVLVKPKDFSLMSLRAPLTVEGTLGSPDVGIDAGELTAKVLGALGLGAIATPAAALLMLIDPGSKSSKDPCVQTGG